MRLPSTRMSSRAGSALVPSSRTVVPLTVTRPSSISCSAARREAMPACDKIFCSLSIGNSVATKARNQEEEYWGRQGSHENTKTRKHEEPYWLDAGATKTRKHEESNSGRPRSHEG